MNESQATNDIASRKRTETSQEASEPVRLADTASTDALDNQEVTLSSDARAPIPDVPSRAPRDEGGFDLDDLAPDTKATLAKIEDKLRNVSRRSTEAAFVLGAAFEKAKEILEERSFKAWVKERSGYDDRTARLYRDVYRTLEPWRKRLVIHAVKPTVLFKLATGDEGQIEAIVGEFEAGKQLTVKDVVARLKGDAGDEPRAPELGSWERSGLSGLMTAARARVQDDAVAFGKVLASIQTLIERTLTNSAGAGRISKKDLADQIEWPARHAKALLEALLFSAAPNPNAPSVIWPKPIPNTSPWARVHHILHQLGGKADWPSSTDLRSWLEFEVLPLLVWALAKDTPVVRVKATSGITVAEREVSEPIVAEPVHNNDEGQDVESVSRDDAVQEDERDANVDEGSLAPAM